MLEAVLSIETPPEWKRALIEKYHANVEVLDCRPKGEVGGSALVRVRVDDGHLDMAMDDIRADPDVTFTDLDQVDRGVLKGTVEVGTCVACCRNADRDSFLIEASLDKDGHTLWRLISQDRSSIVRTIANLEGKGCIVEMEKLTTVSTESFMSSRQEEVLQVAYERGYFDYPKRVSLRELASLFEVSISTLSEMMRKGQRKVMERYFETR